MYTEQDYIKLLVRWFRGGDENLKQDTQDLLGYHERVRGPSVYKTKEEMLVVILFAQLGIMPIKTEKQGRMTFFYFDGEEPGVSDLMDNWMANRRIELAVTPADLLEAQAKFNHYVHQDHTGLVRAYG